MSVRGRTLETAPTPFRFDENAGGYLAEGERPRFFMDPMGFMERRRARGNRSARDLTISVRLLQDRLAALLDPFMNSFAFPAVPLSAPGLSRLNRLIANLRTLGAWVGDELGLPAADSFLSALPRRILSRQRTARILSAGYRLLEECFDATSPVTTSARSPRGIDYRPDRFQTGRLVWIPVMKREVEDRLRPYLAGFWIHGSMSTQDYCDFSDLDTLLVLNRETTLDAERLERARRSIFRSTRFLYLVDPYQHHGHMIFTEIDQRAFAQTRFPLALFAFSTRLLGEDPLRFRLRSMGVDERLRPLWTLVQRIRAASRGAPPASRYAIKLLLAQVMLLPTLFLQALGEHVYKRDSFERAESYFSEDEWEAVRAASAMRRDWRLTGAELALLRGRLVSARRPTPWAMIRRRVASRLGPDAPSRFGRRFVQRAARLTIGMVERAGG